MLVFWQSENNLEALEHEPHLSVKTHLSKTSYHVETRQLICFSAQLTGFYIIGIVTERHFRIDFNLLYSIFLHISKVNIKLTWFNCWVSFKYLSLLFKCKHCELNVNITLLPHAAADLGLLQLQIWSSLWQ